MWTQNAYFPAQHGPMSSSMPFVARKKHNYFWGGTDKKTWKSGPFFFVFFVALWDFLCEKEKFQAKNFCIMCPILTIFLFCLGCTFKKYHKKCEYSQFMAIFIFLTDKNYINLNKKTTIIFFPMSFFWGKKWCKKMRPIVESRNPAFLVHFYFKRCFENFVLQLTISCCCKLPKYMRFPNTFRT